MKKILKTKKHYKLIRENDCFYIEKNDKKYTLKYKDPRDILDLWKDKVENK